MNNTVKGIIAGGAALVVLGGGIAVLKLTEKEPEESSVVQEEVKTLWTYDSDDVSKVTLIRADGEKVVANRVISKQKDVDLDGNDIETDVVDYVMEGYEDLPMEKLSLRLLASRACDVFASQIVKENATDEDLKNFGLDQPMKVRLDIDDQDPLEFNIGDISPDVQYSYVSLASDPKTVYSISSTFVEPYREETLCLLSTTLTEGIDSENGPQVTDVLIERKDLDYNFHFVYDSFYEDDHNGGSAPTLIMVEPVRSLLNEEKSRMATHGLYSLLATDIVKPHPTEEDFAKYGLDDPCLRVTSKSDDGKTWVLTFGDTYTYTDPHDEEIKKTLYYGYFEGINCIYGFSTDELIYTTMKPEDLNSKLVFETYVWDITRLTYQAGSDKLDFTVKAESQDDAVVKVNGRETDPERYRKLYTSLLQSSAEEIVTDEVDTSTMTPLISVHLEQKEIGRGYDVDFYDAGGLKAYIAVNGNVYFKCRKSYVDTLTGNIGKYFSDEDFVMTW